MAYDSSRNDDIGWGLALGCSGVLDVLLERIGVRTMLDPVALIERCVRDQVRGSIATVVRSDPRSLRIGTRLCVVGDELAESKDMPEALRQELIHDCRRAIATGTSVVNSYEDGTRPIDVLVEAIVPPPRLFLFGAGHETGSAAASASRPIHTAVAIANLARAVGWDVFVYGRHARADTRARFAPADAAVVTNTRDIRAFMRESDRALAVVMHDDYGDEKETLALLANSDARYIGVLGPRDRTAKIGEELGIDIGRDPRFHVPIGLASGAAIAIAVVAEAQSVLSRERTTVMGGVETTATEKRGLRIRNQRAHASPT